MTQTILPSSVRLSGERRDQVQRDLRPLLTDLIALALLGKQAHWNVVGPNFRPLHAQLDELVDATRAWADTVAERLVTLGIYPDGQAATVARESALELLPTGPIPDRRAVELIADRVAAVADQAREAMDRVGDVDLASQDVLIEVVQGLEKQLWMLRAQAA
jgi:starvation-inducible DNA-binding protein